MFLSTRWRFELLEGEEVLEALRDGKLLEQWQALAKADPSVTWFQEPPFVSAWYATYAQTHEPLLPLYRSPDGALGALMPLARKRATGEVTHAGGRQAHYHGWIAAPEAEDPFLRATIRAVFERSSRKRWSWRSVPPGKGLGTLFDETRGGFSARVVTRPTPVWSLVADRARRHRNLRKLLQRYRQRGGVALRRAESAAEAGPLLEQMAVWDDFRLGAVRADLPFQDDPLKLAFFKSLGGGGGGARVTGWYVGGHPVAVFTAALDGKGRCLGLAFGSDPAEARFSPTLVGLLELGESLGREGVLEYDLMPGGEPWKERFGTEHRPVTEVEIFADAAEARRARRLDAVVESARSVLRTFGQDPGEVKRGLLALGERAGDAARHIWRRLRLEKTLVFECAPDAVAADLPAGNGSGDSLRELLRYDECHPRDDAQRFFARALRFYFSDWSPLTVPAAQGLGLAAWWHVAPVAGDIEGLGHVPEGVFLLWFAHAGPETGEVEVRRVLAQAVAAARRSAAGPLWVVTSSRLDPVRKWCAGNARLLRTLPPK